MSNFINEETINFREKLSSEKHSKIIKELTDELLDINTDLEYTHEKIEETKEIQNINEMAYKTSLENLNNKFNTLKRQYELLEQNSVYKELYIYPEQFENSFTKGENTSHIDKEGHVAFINYNDSENKVVIKNELYNETFIPDESCVSIEYLMEDDYEIVKEKDPLDIVKEDKIFYSKIKTKRDVSEVLMRISITFPKDIINNNDFNAIITQAFPFNNIDIVSIQYKNLGEKKIINVLDNRPGTEDYILDDYNYSIIKNSKKEIFNFSEIKTDEVYITIRQTHYKDDLNDRYFFIGIENLELLNLNFENDTSVFYSVVEFNTDGEKIIHSIDPIINNINYCNKDDVKIDLSYLDSLNNPIPIKENYPLKINNNKFLIKCSLIKKETTPSVSGFKIKYTT